MKPSTIVRTVALAFGVFAWWEVFHAEHVSAALSSLVGLLLYCASMSMRLGENIDEAVLCIHCRKSPSACDCPASLR